MSPVRLPALGLFGASRWDHEMLALGGRTLRTPGLWEQKRVAWGQEGLPRWCHMSHFIRGSFSQPGPPGPPRGWTQKGPWRGPEEAGGGVRCAWVVG